MTRRQFGVLPALPLLGAGHAAAQAAEPRKKVAAIVTEYRHYSHADVVVGRLLAGYSPNGIHMPHRTQVVSMYTDQVPQNDMSRDLAARNGFKIFPTIEQALTMGAGKFAVDAVVFVGEHGNYPQNELGQKMYPRFELMSQILDVIEAQKVKVPVFCDKHLSYSWEKAHKMFTRVRSLGLPFMAGSSIPVTPRTPRYEVPFGAKLDTAVCLGHGDDDAYGFHLLESLQCMVERRAGGETGIAAVQRYDGDAVWEWMDGEGSWSAPLFEAAAQRQPNWTAADKLKERAKRPILYRLQYRDGLKAAGLILTPSGASWTFAGNVNGALQSTRFGPAERTRPLPHFDGFVRCIEELIITGKPVYPAERTLLTTGALAFLFQSKGNKGKVDTPELSVTYKAPEHTWFQTA